MASGKLGDAARQRHLQMLSRLTNQPLGCLMNKDQTDLQLYNDLGVLLADVPDLDHPSSPATVRWLARLYAVVRETTKYDSVASTELKLAIDNLDLDFVASPTRVLSIAHRVLAILERRVPASTGGAFIPVGDVFDGMVKVGSVVSSAKKSVLFVDAYAAANILSDYATFAAEGVSIEVLAAQNQVKPNLAAATRTWQSQYGQKRPLEVRLAPQKTVHDRAIFIDDREAWTIGTSFNSVATRAPTLLQRVGQTDVFPDKLSAYRSIWSEASPMP